MPNVVYPDSLSPLEAVSVDNVYVHRVGEERANKGKRCTVVR